MTTRCRKSLIANCGSNPATAAHPFSCTYLRSVSREILSAAAARERFWAYFRKTFLTCWRITSSSSSWTRPSPILPASETRGGIFHFSIRLSTAAMSPCLQYADRLLKCSDFLRCGIPSAQAEVFRENQLRLQRIRAPTIGRHAGSAIAEWDTPRAMRWKFR